MRFSALLIALCFFSCVATKADNAGVEYSSTSEDKGVESYSKIKGMVKIYGNEPHVFVGLVDEDGTEYAIYPRAKEDELRQLQGHLLEFLVEFVDEKSYGSLFLKGGIVTPVSWEIIR